MTLVLGPEQGSLTVHTGVAGRAAKAGHALTIGVTDWSATAAFEGPHPVALSLRAALGSLEIISGEGGLKPLSDKDKRTVKSTALDVLSAAAHPEATFVSRSVTARPDGYTVAGDLVLAGVGAAVVVELRVSRADGIATLDALVPVRHTQFGLKPYTGLMGTLRVRDDVEVRLSATVVLPV